MFRKFSKLGVQNLLCMQAELLDLELELKEMIQDHSIAALDQTWSKYNIDYQDSDTQLWRMKHIELREKLETYREKILQKHGSETSC